MIQDLFNAFLVAGVICVLGQLVFDFTTLTNGHITSLFVVIGAGMDSFGLYDKLIEFSGGGAYICITSFGHSLVHAALEKTEEYGILGILSGMFDLTTAGLTSVILFSFIVAIIFRPSKN